MVCLLLRLSWIGRGDRSRGAETNLEDRLWLGRYQYTGLRSLEQATADDSPGGEIVGWTVCRSPCRSPLRSVHRDFKLHVMGRLACHGRERGRFQRWSRIVGYAAPADFERLCSVEGNPQSPVIPRAIGEPSYVTRSNGSLKGPLAFHRRNATPRTTYPKTTPSPPHRVHPRIKPHQTLRRHAIPLPQQNRNINIQRTIRLPSRAQKLLHSFQRTHDTVSRRPGSLEQVEADLAGFEADVGVADGGLEVDLGGCVRVGRWDGY